MAGVEVVASSFAVALHFQGLNQKLELMVAVVEATVPSFSWFKMDWDLASRSLAAKLKFVGVKDTHLYFGGQTSGY